MKAAHSGPSVRRYVWPFLAGWLALVVAGFAYFEIYQNTPGVPATAPARIAAPVKRSRLLVFLHPQCPCSRATVSELSQVVSEVGDRLKIEVYVMTPRSDQGSWMDAPLVKQAETIPHASVQADPDAETARRFGVKTSGEVLLYAPDGALTFSGGITPSRGHEGENVGHHTVVDYVRTGKVPTRTTPVFGCALYASRAERDK